jgi:16S rRNA (cytosine1402-N4)-methyltransferase
MNPQRGQPASALLASLDATRLARMLEENADEPRATLLAGCLVAAQQRQAIETTTALAGAIREALQTRPGRPSNDDADTTVRRVFQALRIAVNDEFSALESFLRQLPDCLAPGGRVAILTFHSGEDRRVKKAFQEGERSGVYARIAGEVVRPGAEEIRANPRSSPAKLRWAVRR